MVQALDVHNYFGRIRCHTSLPDAPRCNALLRIRRLLGVPLQKCSCKNAHAFADDLVIGLSEEQDLLRTEVFLRISTLHRAARSAKQSRSCIVWTIAWLRNGGESRQTAFFFSVPEGAYRPGCQQRKHLASSGNKRQQLSQLKSYI